MTQNVTAFLAIAKRIIVNMSMLKLTTAVAYRCSHAGRVYPDVWEVAFTAVVHAFDAILYSRDISIYTN